MLLVDRWFTVSGVLVEFSLLHFKKIVRRSLILMVVSLADNLFLGTLNNGHSQVDSVLININSRRHDKHLILQCPADDQALTWRGTADLAMVDNVYRRRGAFPRHIYIRNHYCIPSGWAFRRIAPLSSSQGCSSAKIWFPPLFVPKWWLRMLNDRLFLN